MKNFVRKIIRSLVLPTVVGLSIFVSALCAPLAVDNAWQTRILTMASVTETSLTISGLPSRTAEVGDSTAVITGGNVKLYHAGILYTETTYREEGIYEYRFYGNASDSDYYDKYVVSVSKSGYSITLPFNTDKIIPTVVKNGTVTVDLPDIPDANIIKTKGGKTFNKQDDAGEFANITVDKDVSKQGDVLKAKYILKDAGKTVFIYPLTDIQISNESNATWTALPSVSSSNPTIRWNVETTLPTPTIPNAKVGDTEISVEGYTYIHKVEFAAARNDDGTLKNSRDITGECQIDGLKWTPVKVSGYYKITYATKTLWGYAEGTDADFDYSGEYVIYEPLNILYISRDTVSPEIKFTEDYSVLPTSSKELNDEDKYKDLAYKMPDTNAVSLTKVRNGVNLPAIAVYDNGGIGEVRVVLTKLKDENNPSSSNMTVATYRSIDGTDGNGTFFNYDYKQEKSLVIDEDGNYKLDIYVYDTASSTDERTEEDVYKYNNSTSKTYYFAVSDTFINSLPTIADFAVPDIYLADGGEISVAVPTVTDGETPSGNIKIEYFIDGTALDAPVNGVLKVNGKDFTAGIKKIVVKATDYNGDTATKDSASFSIFTASTSTASANGSFAATGKQNVKYTMPAVLLSAQEDTFVSMKVFTIQNGERIYTPIYNDDNEIVGTRMARAATTLPNDWFWTPSYAGEYYIEILTKAVASSSMRIEIKKVTVSANSDIIGVSPFALSSSKIYSGSASVATGDAWNISGLQFTYNGVEYVATNRQIREKSSGVAFGTYTIDIIGSNDYILTGSQFTPTTSGTYKFIYTYYNGGIEIGNSEIVLTAAESSLASGNVKISEIGYDETTITDAIVLEGFLDSNNGGSTNIVVPDEKLTLEAVSGETGRWQYPLIAIPYANVLYDGATANIKVTKQNSSGDALVDTTNLSSTTIANIMKDGFYVFRPTGKFTSATASPNTAVTKSEIAGDYVVTYTIQHNGATTTKEFVISVGDVSKLTLSVEKAKGAVSSLTKNNDGSLEVAVNKKITIDLSKLADAFDGNENMLEWIRTSDTEGATQEEKVVNYLRRNLTFTITSDSGVDVAKTTWSLSDAITAVDALDDINFYATRYEYTPVTTGTYTIKFSLSNLFKTGDTGTASFTFSVITDDSSTNEIDPRNVWGIILIVLSVGLLGGVIYYFIKTGKETKFIGTVRPTSKPKKEKKKDEEKDKV
ncbi:MAG: hypothetical protein LBH47_00675 [Christensenellaceae bacterium]|nr:hypothetical protein [Christensenellaceae bacterium]